MFPPTLDEFRDWILLLSRTPMLSIAPLVLGSPQHDICHPARVMIGTSQLAFAPP
jgi:hypothetical protein